MRELLASAPSREKLEELINRFFYSKNYIITDDNTVTNELRTADQLARFNQVYSVKNQKNRWHFYYNETKENK